MMESSKKKSNQSKPGRPMRGKQGRKDNKSKRVNYDNMREDRVRKIIEEDSKTDSANDVSWYSRNPELLRSVASYPFANILGTPISNYDGSAIPGIVTFAYEPCFGGPSNPALTQCFNSMYSFVVHANSRNQSYDAPDLGILTMAGMQVFSIIGSVLRAYGVVKYYNERNRYLPDALLTAMGFNPDDFRQNLSHIWFDINNFINQTKQIWVPDDLPVMDRWYWLNTNVFSDAEGDQAQMYVFVQNAYYIYSDIAVKTGSSLGPVSSDGTLAPSSIHVKAFSPADTQYNWTVWKGVIQSMIDALIGSQDRGIIYGDILKAYTADRIRALQPIDSSFTLGPVYNAEALMQIENVATVDMSCSGFFQMSDGNMYTNWQVHPSGDNTKTPGSPDDNSAIISTNDNVLLNFHIPTQPTPEMVMIATRMTACQIMKDSLYTISNWTTAGGVTPSKQPTYYPFAVGSEIVNRIRLYQYVSALDGDPGIYIHKIPQYIQTNTSITSGGSTLPGYLAQVLLLEAFDWHPFIYQVDHFQVSKDKAPIDGIQHIRYAYGDIDNYTVIDSLSLAAMHQVAIYSELGVPKM